MRTFIVLGCLLFAGAAVSAGEKIDFPANTWVNITPRLIVAKGAVPEGQTVNKHWSLNHYGGLTYRPETGEILLMDGALRNTGIYASSVFGMDATTGNNTQYKATHWNDRNTPSELNKTEPTPAPRHTYGAWVYVPEKKSVYLWAGANRTVASGQGEFKNAKLLKERVPAKWIGARGYKILGFWVFNFETGKWRSLDKCKTYPKRGFEQEMVWAPKLKKLYLFVPRGGRQNDNVWAFDVETEEWASEGGKTRHGCYGASFYDAKRQTVIFPMAENRKASKGRAAKVYDLGAYHLETKKFEVLPVEGGRPRNIGPGNDAWCHYTKGDLYFGWSGLADAKESWIYDPKISKWKEFLPEKNIQGMGVKNHCQIEYDSKNDLLVVWRKETGSRRRWWALRFDPATARFAKPKVQ